MTQSLISVAIFIALIACIPFAVKWTQRRMGARTGEIGAQSRIISAVAVGPHQRVVTVEIGPEGERVWLTLGVTAQAIHCLHSAPADAPAKINTVAAIAPASVKQ